MKTERPATDSEIEVLKHAQALIEKKFLRDLDTVKFFLYTFFIAIGVGAGLGLLACLKGGGGAMGLSLQTKFLAGFGIGAVVFIGMRVSEYNEYKSLQRAKLEQLRRDFSERALEVYEGEIVFIKELSLFERLVHFEDASSLTVHIDDFIVTHPMKGDITLTRKSQQPGIFSSTKPGSVRMNRFKNSEVVVFFEMAGTNASA